MKSRCGEFENAERGLLVLRAQEEIARPWKNFWMIPYHAFYPLHAQIEYWVVGSEESTAAGGPLRLRALRRYTAACTQRDSAWTIKQGDYRCACSSQEACASVHRSVDG